MTVDNPPDELLVQDSRGSFRPTRRWLVAGALVLALAAVGVVVDREVRAAEAAAVGRCADRTLEEVDFSQRRMRSMIAYVRPVLENRLPPGLQEQLYGMVADAASGSDTGLREVRADCEAIDVLPLHGELRRQRAACLRLLDRAADLLRAVT